MPRPSNTVERRQQIVDALLTVIAEKGYDGASIQAIAKAANLAPGLLHYHFKTKQDILLALVERVAEIGMARYSEMVQTASSPEERLRAFVDAWLALGKGANVRAVRAWVVIGAEAVRQPAVRQAYQKAIKERQALLVSLLSEQSANSLDKEGTLRLAGIVMASMEGSYQLSVTNQKSMPKNYAADTIMQCVETYMERQSQSIAREGPRR